MKEIEGDKFIPPFLPPYHFCFDLPGKSKGKAERRAEFLGYISGCHHQTPFLKSIHISIDYVALIGAFNLMSLGWVYSAGYVCSS